MKHVLTIAMPEPLADRLAAAANVTGVRPEGLALSAVVSLVGHIEREGALPGLPVAAAPESNAEPPAGSASQEVAP